MAIKYKYQCAYKALSAGTKWSLKPKEDECYHITDIRMASVTTTIPLYIDVDIDRNKVGRILTGKMRIESSALNNGLDSNCLGGYKVDPGLKDFKIDYIVANGETITFTAPSTTIYLEIEYDIYDRDDLKSTMPGGSKHGTYYYVGEYNATVTSSGNKPNQVVELLPASNIPNEFLEPIKGTITPSHRVECLGIAAQPADYLNADGSGRITGKALKITKNREVLGNVEGTGVTVLATNTSAGTENTTPRINDFPLFPVYPHKTDVFDEMSEIKPGDKYKFEYVYDSSGSNAVSTILRLYVFWKISQ